MDSTEHRPRPECQQSRRLVEPTARRRAARRQPVEAISGGTGRNHRRGQRARHRTLAKPSGGLCCLGAARHHRRVSWAGNRGDQPRLGRSLSSCRTTWTQSTLRRDRSRDDRRTHGRYRLFSVACSSSPYPFDRYPLRPCLRPTRSRRTHTAPESTALEPLEESQPAHICRLLVFISARERLHAATRR
jgi:hypothetical protein